MPEIVVKWALALISALAAAFCFAQEAGPDVLLKRVNSEVIAIMKEDKEIRRGNVAKVAGLLETKILPLFDFTHMTRIAVARNWRDATSEQQKALTNEFKALLVRTYSSALSSYRGQVIEFKPLRAAPGETEATVKSVIRRPGMEPFTMDYDMEKIAAAWKSYDIKIDGISLISTYRESFAVKVQEDGIDGLIKSLSDRKRPDDAGSRSRQTQNFMFPIIVRSVLQAR